LDRAGLSDLGFFVISKNTGGKNVCFILQNNSSMMKKTLVLTLLLTVLLTACNNVKEPVFEELQDFKVGKMTFEEATLSANLRFSNPNSFGLKLKRIDCDLYVDSSFLGHFSNSEEIKIPASGSFILPVSGQAKTLALLEQSGKAFSGKEAFIRVRGIARVGRSGIFKNFPVDYSDKLDLKFLTGNK
jgi:LEA14-like dessication related protein